MEVIVKQFMDRMRDIEGASPGAADAFDDWVENLTPEARDQAERDIAARAEALLANSLRTRILLDCKAAGMTPTEAGKYCKALLTYLTMAVSNFTARSNSMTTWDNGDAGKYRGVFTRQAIPMVWDYAEVNPFGRSGFKAVVEQMARALERLPAGGQGVKPGVVKMQSAQDGDP